MVVYFLGYCFCGVRKKCNGIVKSNGENFEEQTTVYCVQMWG